MKRLFALSIAAILLSWPVLVTAQTAGGEAIVVIQERAYERKHRVEITALGGWGPTNPFLTYYPIEGRVAFHITETFGVEASFGYFFVVENAIINQMKLKPHYLRVTVFEQQAMYFALGALWTPINGKIRLSPFNAILYWDVYIQMGAGGNMVYDDQPIGKHSKDSPSFRAAFNFGAGFRVWFNKYMALKLDLKESVFQKQKGKGGVFQHTNVMLGLCLII